MGGKNYPIDNELNMNYISKLNKSIDTPVILKWSDIKDNKQMYYSTKFNVGVSTPDFVVNKFKVTEFLNPDKNIRHKLKTNISSVSKTYEGPVNVGPAIDGYGIGMSKALLDKLKLFDGDVVYFKMTE